MNIAEEKKAMQRKYESWLSKDNRQIKQNKNDSMFSDTSFMHTSGIEVHILQKSDQSDTVIIVTKIVVSPEHLSPMAALSSEEKSALAIELASGLINLGVQYVFEQDKSGIKSVLLERAVYGEGLTKRIFFDNVAKMVDASLFTIMKFVARFGDGGKAPPAFTSSGTATRGTPYA